MEVVSESKRVLNPMDRIAEVLFGLIMALTFTCSIGIANTGKTEIRQLLIAAIGCNLAWGLVDATMYLIGVLAHKSRSKMILYEVRAAGETETAIKWIANELPPVVVSAMGAEGLEQVRKEMVRQPDTAINVKLSFHDLRNAFSIFLLVFISTFPIVIPFLFIHDTKLALRVSNLVAIISMFLCGWSLARYVGYNRWIMSIAMVLIGAILVFITIIFGG